MHEVMPQGKDQPRDALATRAHHRFAKLDCGEHRVLTMLLEGASHKVIASRLDVSIRTIESRRARIMQKVGVTSLPALVRWAMLANYNGIATREPE